MQIRQSDLASWSKCPQQVHLERRAAAGGVRRDVLSATVFGTVMHHAAQVMEQLHHEGNPEAGNVAVATFEHYWNPDHIREIEPDAGEIVWLPRQTYGGLLIRGRNNLRSYWEVLQADGGQLLGLEMSFTLPITLDMPTGQLDEAGEVTAPEEHTVHGTIDRLSLRAASRRLFLSVDDFKTGKKPTYLRYAMQWTIYSWATLQPAFWEPFGQDLAAVTEPLAKRGYALYPDGSGLPVIPRRGRWIALRDDFGVHDTGWRTVADWARMKVAMSEYVRSNTAGIFPLSVAGDSCMFCAFARNGACGGVPLATITEGEPDTRMQDIAFSR